MKLKKILLFLLLTSSIGSIAQIGIQTNSPDASAALDIVSTDKGLLIPRVTLTASLSNPSPVTAPATGLMVFNTGANQPVGLYYWNGSSWVQFSTGSGSTNYWGLTGNSGTNPSTNFLGTTDNQDLAIYTNNAERMRTMADGRVVIGQTAPNNATDLFSAVSNATQTWAINGYGNICGVYGSGGSYGIYGSGGTYGVVGAVNNSSSFAVRGDNQDANGWGSIFAGSGLTPSILNSHSAAVAATGNDGIFTLGKSTGGIGIIAGGNNTDTLFTITGVGGAFTGSNGIFARSRNTTGIGAIGVSNNGQYVNLTNGSGGSFIGYEGLVAKGNNATNGYGVRGLGNNLNTIYSLSYGAGGIFTGSRYGVSGIATLNSSNSRAVYGYFDGGGGSYDGIAIYGYTYTSGGWGYGVYGDGNYYGVYANGNLGASGTKSFVIDDPRDPENKILKHYSIESNEVLNLYRGVVQLNGNGEAQVTLPDYFTTININFSYTLTSIGMPAPGLYIKEEIDNNGQFEIGGGNPNQKVSWVVYADRNDPYMQKYRDREVDVVDKKENERGKYIMPDLYNQPPEKGIFYMKKPKKQNIDNRENPEIKVNLKTAKRLPVDKEDETIKEKNSK